MKIFLTTMRLNISGCKNCRHKIKDFGKSQSPLLFYFYFVFLIRMVIFAKYTDCRYIPQEELIQIPWTLSFQAKKYLLKVYLSGLREGDRLVLFFYINIFLSAIYILFQKQVQRSGGEFPTPKRCWIVRFNCNRVVLLINYTKNDL